MAGTRVIMKENCVKALATLSATVCLTAVTSSQQKADRMSVFHPGMGVFQTLCVFRKLFIMQFVHRVGKPYQIIQNPKHDF